MHRPSLAIPAALSILSLLPLLACAADAQVKNGFDLKGSSIKPQEIHRGGPPRDGIPALDHPRFTPAEAAGWLRPDDRVLGLAHGGVAKAYPIRIMDWHEVVNDEIAGKAVAVTYCPLCGSGVAFDAEIDGRVRSFGVSGLLYNSDVLLYDRGTESLWSQLEMEAVSGPMKGTEMEILPLRHTTWEAWREEHPRTLVLSRNTGHRRNYDATPYHGYEKSPRLYFPVDHRDRRFHPKTQVLGVELEGTSKAYPLSELDEALDGKAGTVIDTVGERRVEVRYDPKSGSAAVYEATEGEAAGPEIAGVTAFWFAWAAFHPETEVFEAD